MQMLRVARQLFQIKSSLNRDSNMRLRESAESKSERRIYYCFLRSLDACNFICSRLIIERHCLFYMRVCIKPSKIYVSSYIIILNSILTS